jgi:phosphopantothenoylcysteine decarboxylase/phosphopantothenate--cysteine ligase
VLTNKTVVLGITGGIAAYKAVDIASKLNQAGARVEVVMTESATRFITPLTLRAITGRPVVTSMWKPAGESRVEHIALAEAADVIAIVPATANIIARLATGITDDILSCTVLASKAPVLVAPAMHTAMFLNSITQENLARLKARGFIIIDPASGRLASGGQGVGRLPDTETIIAAIEQTLARSSDLTGRHIVVTAGGTREPIDPVRYVGNRSSGRMGYALAEAARDRGAAVVLITASPHPGPSGIELIPVETASQMQAAVARATGKADALIMAAAVADYRPKNISPTKIKKQAPDLTLELVRNPDILAEAKGSFIKVGFAAESENLVENARKKLEMKQLDIIVANDITEADSGFAVDTNKVTLVDKQGNVTELPLMTKREVADKILDRVGELLTKR